MRITESDIARMSQQDRSHLAEHLASLEGLDSFIRRTTPNRPPPRHIKPVIDVFERAGHPYSGERVKVLISMPPGHAKTTTAANAIAWWLARNPCDTHAYATFSDDAAFDKSVPIRRQALSVGVELSPDTNTKGLWRTTAGGGLIAGGRRGSVFMGKRVHGVFVMDDLFNGPIEANSKKTRDAVHQFYDETVEPRCEDASQVVIGTRWHQDDFIGRMIARGGWEVINLAALAEDNDLLGRAFGEPLWPEMFSLEKLEAKRRASEYAFAALYQGRPVPRGASLFGDARYYDPRTFDSSGWGISLAADPAASTRTSADFSAAVVLAIRGSELTREARVLHVYRAQVSVPQFARDLVALQQEYGGAVIKIESVGAFKAIPQMLREIRPEIRIEETIPRGDKFTRAQSVAGAWNEGRVLVPLDSPSWLIPFLEEITAFTGVSDPNDDQVDALSAAWNDGPTLNMWDVL